MPKNDAGQALNSDALATEFDNSYESKHGISQVKVSYSMKNPREYILYIPAGHKGEKLPVMYVYPGGSLTDIIFFDSASWWQIADEKGLAVLCVCENYTTNPVSVTHTDSNVYRESVVSILKDTIDGVFRIRIRQG